MEDINEQDVKLLGELEELYSDYLDALCELDLSKDRLEEFVKRDLERLEAVVDSAKEIRR